MKILLIAFDAKTAREATAYLKSRPNLTAKAAIEAIKAGRPWVEVQAILQEPCSAFYWERDPRHPRTRFAPQSLVDACGDGMGEFGEQERVETKTMISVKLGPDETPRIDGEKNRNRADCLRNLLEAGFPETSNGWRGGFREFIVGTAAVDPANELAVELTRVYAKRARNAGKTLLNLTASYKWTGSMTSFDLFLSLGGTAEINEALTDALGYLACAEQRGSTRSDRLAVVGWLVEMGATVAPKTYVELMLSPNSQPSRTLLRGARLLDRLQVSSSAEEGPGILRADRRGLFESARKYAEEAGAVLAKVQAGAEGLREQYFAMMRTLNGAILQGDCTLLEAALQGGQN